MPHKSKLGRDKPSRINGLQVNSYDDGGNLRNESTTVGIGFTRVVRAQATDNIIHFLLNGVRDGYGFTA